jgi:RNA-directed DNA polymerase
VPFRRPPYSSSPKGGPDGGRPGTFDLLGFTHYWSRSRKGNWVVKRKTSASRFTRAVRTTAQWCRNNRHRPIAEQHQALSQKLRGHYAYYGITGNSIAMNRFREEMRRVWRKWLVRRKRGNRPPWSWFARLQQRYCLPYVATVHSVCRTRSEGVRPCETINYRI